MSPDQPSTLDSAAVMTIEAFADTIIPGEKRFPDDHAVAGVSTGGGAVEAGALALLSDPAGGLAAFLGDLATTLNAHAERHAGARDLALDPELPCFAALAYPERAALILELTGPEHPEKQIWVNLATFSNMAFDTGAHRSVHGALADGHPGLTLMGFAPPDPDGRWRFPAFSYGRQLAEPHPDTTPSGSPA